jgi:hypothetical protein
MTLNNFTPSPDELAKWKVLQSPDLLAILKRMEGGAKLRISVNGGSYFLLTEGLPIETVSVRKFRTLAAAGLIIPEVYEDFYEYRLTYTGSIEEMVRK